MFYLQRRIIAVVVLSACLFFSVYAEAKSPFPAEPSYERAQKLRHVEVVESTKSTKDFPVDLSADNLVHDEATQMISASGNVEIIQAGRILRADVVRYDLKTDTVMAQGNVVLTDPNGDVHFADEVKLTDKMRHGFIKGLQSYLANGGRFIADSGQKSESEIKMKGASYTPCECEEGSSRNPAWQIRAREVTYHEDESRISYKHAIFEVFGVPVLYTPYLSHPDGKVERKSGLLTPGFGFDSELGAVVENNYYWSIAPDKDATIGVILSSDKSPVGLLEYRQRFARAALKIESSFTKSDRTDRIAGLDVRQKDAVRGHMFLDSQWDINNEVRAGLDLELTSDDQYLRQYDFSGKSVLENELYVERFSGRNYAVGRLLAFQDLRVGQDQVDQPNVLPEVQLSFLGEPNALLRGRWNLDFSALGLQRESGGQDVARFVAEAGWQKRHATNFGLLTVVDMSARADAFRVSDKDVATPGSGQSTDGTATRLFSQLHIMSSYPLVKQFNQAQAVIKPLLAITLAPNVKVVDSDIPNEDSQDVQLDASNLFKPNRFPGKDRLEDRSRVTYGIRTGLYGYDISYADFFIGQSSRFNEDDNPFPKGSGLSRQESDFVGQFSALYQDRLGVNYRFQLDGRDLTSQRHEFDGFARWNRLSLGSRYLFAKALEGTDISESREQINMALSYDVTDNWRFHVGSLHDLGENPGLREASFGLDYSGCCLSFSLTSIRRLTTISSGDSGVDISFRIGLKGLGESRNATAHRANLGAGTVFARDDK